MDSKGEVDGNGSTMDRDVLGLLRSLRTFEPAERGRAISVLRSLDREPAIDSLQKLIRDANGEVRCDAAEALMRVDSKIGTEAVLPLLSDADADVRWHTCGLLYDFGDERATPGLVAVLRSDTEGFVRLFAADALGKVGDCSALPSLLHAEQFDPGQDHEGRRVSQAAREAIEGIQRRNL